MSEYKHAITAAGKHVYGENTSEISFTQLKILHVFMEKLVMEVKQP